MEDYRRSQDIWKTTLGPKHPEVASSLNNMAGLLRQQVGLAGHGTWRRVGGVENVYTSYCS